MATGIKLSLDYAQIENVLNGVNSVAGGVIYRTADGACRAATANDLASYSPVVQLGSANSAFSLASGSAGLTYITNSSSTAFVITVPSDTSIPVGFEVALCNFSCKSMKITFASGTKVLVYGNTSPLSAPSFTLETYAMVALKKLTSSDYWLLTGPAEVTT